MTQPQCVTPGPSVVIVPGMGDGVATILFKFLASISPLPCRVSDYGAVQFIANYIVEPRPQHLAEAGRRPALAFSSVIRWRGIEALNSQGRVT